MPNAIALASRASLKFIISPCLRFDAAKSISILNWAAKMQVVLLENRARSLTSIFENAKDATHLK